MVMGRFQNNGMHYNKSTNAAELNPRKIGQILHHLWTWQHISMQAHQTPFRAHVLLEVLQQMI